MVFESNQKFRISPHSQFLVAGTKPHARVLASSHKELHIYNHVATNRCVIHQLQLQRPFPFSHLGMEEI